jgi:hypothetical protein
MTSQVWAIAALALLLAPATASAESAEIEHRCTAKYPNISQYFAWKDCVKIATQLEVEENLKRQKEEAARPCLAADMPRMEGLVAKASGAVKSESSLEEAQAALGVIFGYQGTITIPKDSIKDRVLVSSINSRCDAPFYFLINVREGPDKKLRWLRTWAEDAPAGYSSGLHQEFSAEFEAERERERFRAEAAKRDEDFRAIMAKQEREREEQRQETLRSVKISDVKLKCMGAGFCSIRILEFMVTNVSKQPIKRISFGWMLRSPQMTECPAKLATKEVHREVLQPGEKHHKAFILITRPKMVT